MLILFIKNFIPSKQSLYLFCFIAGPEAATVGEQGRKYKTWSVGKAVRQKQASDSGLGQATLRQGTHAHREAKSDGAASLPLVSKAHPGLTLRHQRTRDSWTKKTPENRAVRLPRGLPRLPWTDSVLGGQSAPG